MGYTYCVYCKQEGVGDGYCWKSPDGQHLVEYDIRELQGENAKLRAELAAANARVEAAEEELNKSKRRAAEYKTKFERATSYMDWKKVILDDDIVAYISGPDMATIDIMLIDNQTGFSLRKSEIDQLYKATDAGRDLLAWNREARGMILRLESLFTLLKGRLGEDPNEGTLLGEIYALLYGKSQ